MDFARTGTIESRPRARCSRCTVRGRRSERQDGASGVGNSTYWLITAVDNSLCVVQRAFDDGVGDALRAGVGRESR